MEKSIPKESNCSYIASIWTDVLACLAGALLIYRGYLHNDIIISGCGLGILVEHTLQTIYHKLDSSRDIKPIKSEYLIVLIMIFFYSTIKLNYLIS